MLFFVSRREASGSKIIECLGRVELDVDIRTTYKIDRIYTSYIEVFRGLDEFGLGCEAQLEKLDRYLVEDIGVEEYNNVIDISGIRVDCEYERWVLDNPNLISPYRLGQSKSF